MTRTSRLRISKADIQIARSRHLPDSDRELRLLQFKRFTGFMRLREENPPPALAIRS
jgi:hypothetical protein